MMMQPTSGGVPAKSEESSPFPLWPCPPEWPCGGSVIAGGKHKGASRQTYQVHRKRARDVGISVPPGRPRGYEHIKVQKKPNRRPVGCGSSSTESSRMRTPRQPAPSPDKKHSANDHVRAQGTGEDNRAQTQDVEEAVHVPTANFKSVLGGTEGAPGVNNTQQQERLTSTLEAVRQQAGSKMSSSALLSLSCIEMTMEVVRGLTRSLEIVKSLVEKEAWLEKQDAPK